MAFRQDEERLMQALRRRGGSFAGPISNLAQEAGLSQEDLLNALARLGWSVEIRRRGGPRKGEISVSLRPVSCSCEPLPGPAQVVPRPCPRCGRPWRCPACGRCRGCRLGLRPDRYRERALERLVRRLVKGQAVISREDAPEEWLTAWADLEALARWLGLRGCIHGPGASCPPDRVPCLHCLNPRGGV